MEKFDCNLKCPFFLHISIPMVPNDQKLWYFIKNEIFKIMTNSWKRICSKRSEMHTDNSLMFFYVYIFYYKFENDFVDAKYLCCYYAVYHNWKVSRENFLLLISRTCRFIFYIELSSLWIVNNTIFCLFWLFYYGYRQQIRQYFVSSFILHQLGTAQQTFVGLEDIFNTSSA